VDVPVAIWVHYEYIRGHHTGHTQTATQRIRLDLPHFKCERLAHLTNHIFAKGYLPCHARSLVSWKAACGKHVEENAKVEDVLSWGEGVCEDKPLRLVIGKFVSLNFLSGDKYSRVFTLTCRLVSRLRLRTHTIEEESKLSQDDSICASTMDAYSTILWPCKSEKIFFYFDICFAFVVPYYRS
jgi:hypothetical protein